MHRAFRTAVFNMSQRAAPMGQRVFPLVAESPSRATLAGVLKRWPNLWGMFDDGEYAAATRQAYRHAFPAEDAETFTTHWIASRGEHLAASMVHSARVTAGRRSSLVDADSGIKIAGGRPCVIALLHYSIDPVVTLAVIFANPARSFRCPLFPLQPGIEDDRALWLTRAKIPPAVEKTLLPVTASSWLIAARSHVERGGDVLIAMDAPFDRRRHYGTSLNIGQTTMPMASSIEILSQTVDARLLFAWPELRPGKAWVLHVDAVGDTRELASAASRWIERNRLSWAGWPYLRWRETAVSMRRTFA
jgi:hypothetical protein